MYLPCIGVKERTISCGFDPDSLRPIMFSKRDAGLDIEVGEMDSTTDGVAMLRPLVKKYKMG